MRPIWSWSVVVKVASVFLFLLVAIDPGIGIAQKGIAKGRGNVKPITVEHALTADKATDAGHANEADHAKTADRATDAGHATTADAAATAQTATRADTADTLSPSRCQPGDILVKGASSWECTPLPATGIPLFASISSSPTSDYAFAAILSETYGMVAFVMPRDGVLSKLVVQPSAVPFPVDPSYTATITLVVNGLDTTLSIDTIPNDRRTLKNNTARISVHSGDTIAFKSTRTGGTCDTALCPGFNLSILLE